MNIYIVIIEDRYSDTEAKPFSTATAAIDYAKRTAAPEYYRREDNYGEILNETMKKDGWLWHATYKDNNVRVIEREIDAA